jgi:hypothetical protein
MNPLAAMRRMPIWLKLGIIVTVLVIAWWSIGAVRHRFAIARFHATLAELRHSGFEVLPEDLLPSLPQIDTDRQRRLNNLMKKFQELKFDPIWLRRELADVVEGCATSSAIWNTTRATALPLFDALRVLAAEGPICLNATEWMRSGKPPSHTYYVGDLAKVVSLLDAQAICTEAVPALNAYDILLAARGSDAGSTSLVFSPWKWQYQRSRLMLDLERMGRLPPDRRDTWLREPSEDSITICKHIAAEIRGDRLLGTQGILDGIQNDNLWWSDDYPDSEWFVADPSTWWEPTRRLLLALARPARVHPLDGDIRALRYQASYESYLMGKSDCPDLPQGTGWWNLPFIFRSDVRSALSSERFRLAARLVADMRAGRDLPRTEDVLRERYGEHVLNAICGLRHSYERLGPYRFRLTTAPVWSGPSAGAIFDGQPTQTAALPAPCIPPDEIPDLHQQLPTSTAPSRHCVITDWACEIELSETKP